MYTIFYERMFFMKKKIIAMIFATLLICGLFAGCSSNDDMDMTTTTMTTTTTTETTTKETTTNKVEEAITDGAENASEAASDIGEAAGDAARGAGDAVSDVGEAAKDALG